MMLLRLALKSLRSRVVAVSLTTFSIALSMMLLAGVDCVRNSARAGFAGTLSHTDLVVGARGGDLPLLLSTVFHLGNPSANVSWQSYQRFAQHPAVAWTIPISMGDSYKGYRVIATDENLYRHYQFRGEHMLQFASGRAPAALLDAAVGAEVAAHLRLTVGQRLTLTHGVETHSILNHDNISFTVTGVLQRTATPIDNSVFITLLGDEAMHFGWSGGTPPAIGETLPILDPAQLKVDEITSFLVGTKSRISTLSLQREINTYKPEPLSAIIPAYTLQQLWTLLDVADTAFSLVSAAVLVVGLLAVLSALYMGLNERRLEMATLRAIGLHPRQIFLLFVFEAALIAAAGTLAGLAALYSLLFLFQSRLEALTGIPLSIAAISWRVQAYAAGTIVCAALLGSLPAWHAYRQSLADGLQAP